jgi:hypothetical protein
MSAQSTSPVLPLAALLLGCCAAPACGQVCIVGSSSTAVVCDTSGEASLSAPPELGLGSAMHVDYAQSCLATDGTCTVPISFSISDQRGGAPHPDGLHVMVMLPLMEGAATFTIPASDVAVTAFLAKEHQGTIELQVSGTIGVQSSSSSGFRASFDLQLRMPDGQVLSITGGKVASVGCELDDVCSIT